MFPVGLLNSIHKALEPHNDKGKDFHFCRKHSCWWHKLDGQFRMFAKIRQQNICHQNLSPTSICGFKMKKTCERSRLYSKSTKKTEHIEKPTLHGQIFDINWSFQLIINVENLSPKSRRQYVIIKIPSGSWNWTETFFYGWCMYLSAIFLSNS